MRTWQPLNTSDTRPCCVIGIVLGRSRPGLPHFGTAVTMRNLRPTALAELFMKLGGGYVIEQHFDKRLREVEPREPQTERHPLRGRSVHGQLKWPEGQRTTSMVTSCYPSIWDEHIGQHVTKDGTNCESIRDHVSFVGQVCERFVSLLSSLHLRLCEFNPLAGLLSTS